MTAWLFERYYWKKLFGPVVLSAGETYGEWKPIIKGFRVWRLFVGFIVVDPK